MSALPPGYSRCPNDAGHIYPSYLPECNVCADLRARGQSIPGVMVNMDTTEPAIEESVWPKVLLLTVVVLAIGVGVVAVARQQPDQPTSQVAQQTTERTALPPRPNVQVTPSGPYRPAPLPPQRPLEVPVGSPYTGEDGYVRLASYVPEERILPLPAATRGGFKAQDGDLAGHWEIQQADRGGTLLNLDISPIGDSYSAYVQSGVHSPRPNNLSIAEYDGRQLIIQENWAMLGGTDYKMQRVGPQLFEGDASFNGRKLFAVKMVKTFE